ncbi:helix-turn-helix domain-containing protein [Rhodococcus sp. NPDC058521]|uniref:helix-turn-helix domain-containing protein n=1 Tax=Rhodococcus sp. NPDC058521 TaxID=3346536 RepID=UPI00365070DE
MEALVVRLSRLDPEAEGTLRVVMFYDTLMRRRVDLPALSRASAGLADCVVGIALHSTGKVVRFSPDGIEAADSEVTASLRAPVVLDDEEIGSVWLERAGETVALDEVLLDRLAIACAAVVERYGPAHTTMADPALVELAISPDTDDAARDRALRLLGFAPGAPIRVAAVRSEIPLDRVSAAVCAGRHAKASSVAGVGVVLVSALRADSFPAGVCAGIGAADGIDCAWAQARTALRFTSTREPVVRYEDLGAVALLAHVPSEVVGANADVTAMAGLVGRREDLETLDAYCATGSLRRSAEILHLHHSSVARRVEQLGRSLGFDLTDPAGLVRAQLGLAAWRMLES